MGLFSRLFQKKATAAPTGSKRYKYLTGNVEFAERVERGEKMADVMAHVQPRWTPGNEYLWDEYDPESLIDTPEKRSHIVNVLLFGRIWVYRALRAAGRDVRGQDPYDLSDQVPELMAQLQQRFPGYFGDGPPPGVQVTYQEIKLSPGDPGPDGLDKANGSTQAP